MDESPQVVEELQFDRRKLPTLIVGLVGVCGLACALLFMGMDRLPPSVTQVSTPQPTATSAPSLTPTALPTYTPRPTQTSTPIPAWVTIFAEPILAAIANTSPHFEDDFSQASDGWRVDQRDDRCRVKIQDGAFTMSVEAGREMAWCSNSGLRFGNFVLLVEIDLRDRKSTRLNSSN